MIEEDVRRLVAQLYTHVAALPWKDEGFTKSKAAQGAAEDQIVSLTVHEIMKLQEAIV